jgi:hypothetical protein
MTAPLGLLRRAVPPRGISDLPRRRARRAPASLFLAFALSLLPNCAGPAQVGLTDVAHGGVHDPLAGEPGDVVVVIFSSVDCPVANALAPEVQRVADEAEAQGARAYLVHVLPTLQDAEAVRHADDHALDLTVLVDREHVLVKALGATTTPEGVVLRFDDEGWNVLYRGRVNDLYAGLGRRRAVVTRNDLRDAVTAAVEGRAPGFEAEPAVGCLIEPLP